LVRLGCSSHLKSYYLLVPCHSCLLRVVFCCTAAGQQITSNWSILLAVPRMGFSWTNLKTEECCLRNMTQCGSSKNRRFRGMYHLQHQRDKDQKSRNNVSSN
jgi:hypothetical protein